MNALILAAALAAGQPAPLATAPAGSETSVARGGQATFHSPAPVAAKGDVKAGPPLAHAFDLVNGTAGTVTVTKVEAGCGCLRQGLGANVLAPGERTKLGLEVNTLTQPDGPNRWQVAVSYTLELPGMPPQPGELLLQITAALSREIAVSPPQVAFSTEGEAGQVLKVTDKRAKPLTVLKAVASAPHLSVEIGAGETKDGVRTQPVTVKLLPTAPAGHRDEAVVLYTDDADCPELRVPVRVLKRVAGGVVATPDAVSVRFAPGQAEVSTLVQLRSPDGKAVSIAGAESDLPGVGVKCSTGRGPAATVRVTVPEAVAGQPGRCTVRVRLSEPAGEVTIPVSWGAAKK